jgi:hypothetical protein
MKSKIFIVLIVLFGCMTIQGAQENSSSTGGFSLSGLLVGLRQRAFGTPAPAAPATPTTPSEDWSRFGALPVALRELVTDYLSVELWHAANRYTSTVVQPPVAGECVYSPNRSHFVTSERISDKNHRVVVINATTSERVFVKECYDFLPYDFSWSHTGRLLAYKDHNHAPRIIDPFNGRPDRFTMGADIAWSPIDDNIFAVIDEFAGGLQICNASTNTVTRTISGPGRISSGMRWNERMFWHPQGKLISVLDQGGIASIYEIASGECLHTLSIGRLASLAKGYIYTDMAFSPDGSSLALLRPTLSVDLYDVSTGNFKRTIAMPGATHVLWPCDKRLCIGTQDTANRNGTVHIVDSQMGTTCGTVPATLFSYTEPFGKEKSGFSMDWCAHTNQLICGAPHPKGPLARSAPGITTAWQPNVAPILRPTHTSHQAYTTPGRPAAPNSSLDRPAAAAAAAALAPAAPAGHPAALLAAAARAEDGDDSKRS